ncbi:MAG: DUF3179 domain-containing protein [Candidatus Pacebacteria bacterium]|jgi:cytochrome c biogenesis protein CcdA|nr:DUF3179 domain-containing protein [Candidatus Paceibacterota bacterium]MBT4652129.1 DUF3179 domain-containing protein [Candidatus Paceibacterota bacterium]MBT6756560.1 DUF3179 domain-containing protein [Candidatus Paceibacterota bacterium]
MFYLFPIVFISGILTVLSPCVLPILPIILSSGLDGKKSRIYGTITGLVVSFTFFALLLSSFISALGISSDTLRIIASVILGFFGLSLVIPKIWITIQGKLETVFHAPTNSVKKDSGFGGGFLTGVTLGLVWTPCVGPIIATVTTLASLQSFSIELLVLMFTYSIGIAIPLFAIAQGGSYISQKMGWYKKNQTKVRKWFGIIIIATSLLISSGLERKFQSWVLDNLPESISNPVGNFEEKFSESTEIEQLEKELNSGQNNKEGEEVVNKVKLRIESEGAKINLSEILDGCPSQDCIKSIDNPQYETLDKADDWLQDNDLVFILTHKEQTKIFPQRIMNWHEIVNDWFGDDAIAVTFCPLCGTATAFERKVDGVITEFGVSGKLHNSDLIMYDRYEGSLWQQVTGEAITGPAARRDEELEPLFLISLPWKEAKEEFINAEVLSRKTGHVRNYDAYPYGSYESNSEVGFGAPNDDERLHPKDWIYGIEVDGVKKAYPEDKLKEISIIEDLVGENKITIENNKGIISFRNTSKDEKIIPLRSFWFAWAAFNPDTEVYTGRN